MKNKTGFKDTESTRSTHHASMSSSDGTSRDTQTTSTRRNRDRGSVSSIRLRVVEQSPPPASTDLNYDIETKVTHNRVRTRNIFCTFMVVWHLEFLPDILIGVLLYFLYFHFDLNSVFKFQQIGGCPDRIR